MPFDPSPIKRGHEPNSIREGWVMFTAVALAITVPILLLVVWFKFRSLAGDRYAGLTHPMIKAPQSEPGRTFPEPRLQTISGDLWRRFETNEEQQLNSYGWADSNRQFVRLPIERAMDLIAQRGLPVRDSNINNAGPSEMDLVRERRLDTNLAPIKEVR